MRMIAGAILLLGASVCASALAYGRTSDVGWLGFVVAVEGLMGVTLLNSGVRKDGGWKA